MDLVTTLPIMGAALRRHGSSIGLGLMFLACFGLGSAIASERARIENRYMAVEVSRRDGAIVSLSNKLARIELLSRVGDQRQPWLLLLDGPQFLSDFDTFGLEPAGHPDQQELTLRWTTKAGIV